MEKSCREDETNDDNNNTKKKPSSSPAEAAVARWSELPLDTLGEIKKRLFGGDHVRFRSVCKSWKAAPHSKRASDTLPWPLLIDPDSGFSFLCYMSEPSGSGLKPVFSHDVDITPISVASLLQIPCHITYHHGCLLISTDDKQSSYSHFSLFSLVTHKRIQLPRLNWLVARTSLRFFTAVSSNPTAPDCVFLALHITKDHTWHISTFQHGHTRWSTKVYTPDEVPDYSCVEDVVFARGVFYFLFSGGRLGSYQVANRQLNVDHYSKTNNNLQGIRKFFKLFVWDEELVVTYYMAGTDPCRIFHSRFDWSQKDWVPVGSLLRDRRVFLSEHSVFVDPTNYYGISPHTFYLRGDTRSSGGKDMILIWVEPNHFLQ